MKRYPIDVVIKRGMEFGRLVVIKELPDDGSKFRKAKCKCVCGNTTTILLRGLIKDNAIKSCGCYQRERQTAANRKRAKWNLFAVKFPMTYRRWDAMIGRCERKGGKNNKIYKTVIICKGLHDPRHLKKTIGIWKKERTSLDRFPICNGNYTCGDCEECKEKGWKLNIRWATIIEQCRNKTTNTWIEAFGLRKTRVEWLELSGLNDETFRNRIGKHGWSIEKALTTPNRKGDCYKPNVIHRSYRAKDTTRDRPG